MSKFETLKMKDAAESYRVHKGLLPDLPMRMLIVGKSQISGKTNLCGNLMLRPYDETDKAGKDLYMNDFKGENIYVICPSTNLDTKWMNIVKDKRIPEQNIIREFDEEVMNTLYESLEEEFHTAVDEGRKPDHKLIIMDDISFDGSLKSKMHGSVARLACNSRHLLVSVIILAQKYSDVLTTFRENMSCGIFFECSQKQLDLIADDHSLQSKRDFTKMFRETTKEPHSWLCVNYSNPREQRFLNHHFEPIAFKES